MHDGLTYEWAGEPRLFRLGLGQLFALEKARDCGVAELLMRIDAGRWRVEDVQEIIRQGLMGSGLPLKDAAALVADNLVPGRLAESVLLAKAILLVALYGAGGETPGKKDGAAEEAAA